jgi:hypothetical protein
MTKLKTLAVTAIATLAIGGGGLAAAPSAAAKPIFCKSLPALLNAANQALAQGKYSTASSLFETASELMKHC